MFHSSDFHFRVLRNSFKIRSVIPFLSIVSSLAFADVGADAAAFSGPRSLEASGAQELWLAVSLNGVPRKGVFRFQLSQDGDIHVTGDVLSAIGVRWPDLPVNGSASLRNTPGVVSVYNETRQEISIVVPVQWLASALQRYDGRAGSSPVLQADKAATGVVLGYDLYAQRSGKSSVLSENTEFNAFTAGSDRFSTGILTHVSAGSSDGARTIRLDSAWTHDDPQTMVALTAGDFTTSSLTWTRSLRMAGLQVARNFSLQPYTVTTPLPGFAGTAVLPSTVDLYINGMKQASQSVSAGTFQIDNVPSINGAGQAQMVITDINGATRTVTFPLYVTSQLLKAGVFDGSLDVGTPRTNYGISSFSYTGTPVIAGSVRYGVSDGLTLEAHAESSTRLVLAGFGATWLVSPVAGVFSQSLATSNGPSGSGCQAGVSYEWNSATLNFHGSILRRTANYEDIAALDGVSLPLVNDIFYLGLNLRSAQLGLSWIQQRYQGHQASRYLGLSLSHAINARGAISVSIERSLGAGGVTAFATLSLSLRRYSSYSVSLGHRVGGNTLNASATQSAPSDESGWGWRLDGAMGATRSARAQATYLGRSGELTADVSQYLASDSQAVTAASAELVGSVVLIDGHARLTRRVVDAFALVDTGGIPGVPVRYQNRSVGLTDDHGILLVNNLNSYQHNVLSIDALHLPADTRVANTQIDAVPGASAGVTVHFDLKPVLGVQIELIDEEGEHVVAGSAVSVDGYEAGGQAEEAVPVIVGFDGVVYLENPPAGARLHVVEPGRGRCVAVLPDLAARTGLMSVRSLRCMPVVDSPQGSAKSTSPSLF